MLCCLRGGAPQRARRSRRVRTISSRQNPIVKRYRALAAARAPSDPCVLLEGDHLVREARTAGLRIASAAFAARLLERDRAAAALADDLARADAEVVSVSDAVMAAISPVRTPSGVIAIGERSNVTLDEALREAPQTILIAVDVQDPGNLGALIRAAEAGGATAVLTCGASADPFGWKALRGAMGSAFRLPVVRADTPLAVDAARRRSLTVLATDPRGGRSIFDADLTGPLAFLMGAEGPGLDPAMAALADARVSIPMRPPVESLNVAVAAALLVYETSRQRAARAPADGAAGRARRQAGHAHR